MTTALDTKLGLAVENLLNTVGKAVEFDSAMFVEYDATDDTINRIGERRDTWLITPPAAYRRDQVDGATVLESDVQTYIRAKDIPFIPEAGRVRVRFDNEVWEIVTVTRIFSGDDVVLYELQLRK